MMTALSIVSNPADKILDSGWVLDRKPIGSLWLGSKLALDLEFLNKNEISTIISLCPTEEIFPPHIKQFKYDINDDVSHNNRMLRILPDMLKNIHYERLRGHNVLIHCRGGMQRAPTVTTMYLEKYYYNNKIKEIIKKIRNNRPIAFSNGYTFKKVLFHK